MDFKGVRPYASFSFSKLLRLKSFFISCKFPQIVGNLSKIYNISSNIIGKNMSNQIIKFLYSDILTGGFTYSELQKNLEDKQRIGLNCTVGNCHEFLEEKDESHVREIIETYKNLISLSIKYNEKNTISLKISSFCEINKMKKYNTVQHILQIVEEGVNNNLTLDELNRVLNKSFQFNLNQEFFDYLKEKSNTKFGLNLLIFIENGERNHFISSGLLTEDEFNYGKEFIQRLDEVINFSLNKNCSILYDAEQTYIQKIIDASAFLFADRYNKNFPTILQTFQAYLIDSEARVDKYLKFIKENNLHLGVKMVRGAYLVEESKIAKIKGDPLPIWSSFEETSKNYDGIAKKLINIITPRDKIVLASHNEDSVNYISQMAKGKDNVYCAQLIGISDHMTLISKKNDMQTIKYISFGTIDIMIPYLIRRAEETSIVQKLQTQNRFLNEEFKIRLKVPLAVLFGFIIFNKL